MPLPLCLSVGNYAHMQTVDTNQALLSLFLGPGNEAKAAEIPQIHYIMFCYNAPHNNDKDHPRTSVEVNCS